MPAFNCPGFPYWNTDHVPWDSRDSPVLHLADCESTGLSLPLPLPRCQRFFTDFSSLDRFLTCRRLPVHPQSVSMLGACPFFVYCIGASMAMAFTSPTSRSRPKRVVVKHTLIRTVRKDVTQTSLVLGDRLSAPRAPRPPTVCSVLRSAHAYRKC